MGRGGESFFPFFRYSSFARTGSSPRLFFSVFGVDESAGGYPSDGLASCTGLVQWGQHGVLPFRFYVSARVPRIFRVPAVPLAMMCFSFRLFAVGGCRSLISIRHRGWSIPLRLAALPLSSVRDSAGSGRYATFTTPFLFSWLFLSSVSVC